MKAEAAVRLFLQEQEEEAAAAGQIPDLLLPVMMHPQSPSMGEMEQRISSQMLED